MKKTSALITTLLFALFSHTEIINITIDAQEEIKNNNYYFNNSSAGEIVIEKRIEIPANALITSINPLCIKRSGLLLPSSHARPDYSLSGSDSFFHDAFTSHVNATVSRIANSTVLIISFCPAVRGDTAGVAEIGIEYSVEENETKNSIYDRSYYPVSNRSYAKSISDTATLDMVIITSEKFSPALDDFCRFENLMGIKTIIAETESIYSAFSGADNQERIRNYIKSQYSSKGIRFVLIAGGTDIVPVRYSYSSIYYHVGYIPTDDYYADMNGDWNMDRDGEIGELMCDIEDGFADITVSRIPFSDEGELENLLSKFYAYVFRNNSNRIRSFLHCGASLLSDLKDGSGQLMSDMIIGMDGFSSLENTKLYAPSADTFNDVPLYAGDAQLNRNSFASFISSGYHFINHIDHSSEFYMGTGNLDTKTEYNSQDTLMISNPDSVYSVMFTMGCSANGYDRNSSCNGLLLSLRSGICNIVGFTRTGWTSSQALMNRYWKMMLDSSAQFIGDALRFAIIDNSIYFRVAVNMIGFATMPVYTMPPKQIYASLPDSVKMYDTLRIEVSDGSCPVTGATVVLMDDENYLRTATDASGYAVVLPGRFSGKILVGISKKNFIPLTDSLYAEEMNLLSFSEPMLNPDNSVSLSICNKSGSAIVISSLHAGGNDSLLFFNYDVQNAALNAGESLSLNCPLYSYKRPLATTVKKIGVEVCGEALSICDSLPIVLNALEFRVSSVTFPANDGPTIDTLGISKSDTGVSSAVYLKIRSLTNGVTVSDSVHEILGWSGGQYFLSGIKLKKNGGNVVFSDASYMVILQNDLRADTIAFTGVPSDTSVEIFASAAVSGNSVYYKQTKYSAEIYSSRSIDGEYSLKATLKAGETLFNDDSAGLGTTYYYAVFRDDIGRVVDTSSAVSACRYLSITKSASKTSGSLYGTIDGKRYYARSSMNSADLNKDGFKEIVILADDGSLLILDSDLKDVTSFSLMTNPHNETTPAIGDIDMNGYPDIVIGNGSAASETTAFVVYNPMTSPKITAVLSLGTLTASPVIADINCDRRSEVLLGTSRCLAVLNGDLSLNQALTKQIVNVWGIAVSEADGKIFANDYYGNIYSYDFLGNSRQGFPYRIGLVTVTPLIVTDIDSDTKLDIILGTASGKLYVVNEDGTLRAGFPHSCLAGIYQTPRIFDIGNDHNLEMVFSDINGNLYVVNNCGMRLSTLATNDPTNTYNELLVYDFNGDMTEDFVFVQRSGKISVYNQQLSPLYPQFVKLNDIVTCSPLASDLKNEMKPSLIIRDYAGNIYRIDSYSSSSAAGKICFAKTLYDEKNTSFVDGFLLKSENDDRLDAVKKPLQSANIKSTVVKNEILLSYSSEKSDLDGEVYDVLGNSVMNFTLPKTANAFKADISTLPSGNYFVTVTGEEGVILKKKILSIR